MNKEPTEEQEKSIKTDHRTVEAPQNEPLKPRKSGWQKGPRLDKVPFNTQERMYGAWRERQSYEYVSRLCGVAVTTVKAYRKKKMWDARLQREREAQIQAPTNEVEIVKATMIEQLAGLRIATHMAALKAKYKDAGSAVRALIDIIRLELQLRGEVVPDSVKLIMIAAKNFQEAKKTPAAKEVEAESVTIPG